jgi:hypothetical protein
MKLSAAEELDALAYVKNYFIKNKVSLVFCPQLKMFAAYLDMTPKQVEGKSNKNVCNNIQLMPILSKLSRNDSKQPDSPSSARLGQPQVSSKLAQVS